MLCLDFNIKGFIIEINAAAIEIIAALGISLYSCAAVGNSIKGYD